MTKRLILFISLILLPFCVQAQDVKELRDTLRSSLVVSDKPAERDAGSRIIELPALRTMVSATGEADPIKFVQTLPGVSTGVEGSSAIYVRGGNVGSNQTTLDGVPIYGGSHLLGLTSSYPADVVSSMNIRIGGFRGDEGNMTASHIGIRTADGSFSQREVGFSASSFILGGTVSTPIVKDRLSLLASARVSPIGPEFRAVQAMAGGALDSLSRVRAAVYDLFAKVKWLRDEDNTYSASIFTSWDAYSYCYGGDSNERLGWGNMIINLHHEGNLRKGWAVEDGIAYNRFSNSQGIVRDMSGTVNDIAIVSSLDEITADAVYSHAGTGRVGFRTGFRERFTWFNPGTSSTFSGSGSLLGLDSPRTDHITHSSITTVHGQMDIRSGERFHLMSSSRINAFVADQQETSHLNFRINPELSLEAGLSLTSWLKFEATADWTVQYHHTLEGIPLGWSADLIVPTSISCPPEQARQYYAGIFTSFGQHRVTAGAYDKTMHNLVYFLDAGQLFSPTISGWSNNVKVGRGTSRGVEFLYEKDGERLDLHAAYTLSKTDRQFDMVNNNLPFPAKFDRRHILNVSASYVLSDDDRRRISLTGLYALQSGHWETVAAGEYPVFSLTGEESTFDYFSGVNNYEMPTYVRLDIGCNFTFRTRHEQSLNIGVYNVLNRHNPLSFIYDDKTRTWRKVSLFPIMPSFSYRIEL